MNIKQTFLSVLFLTCVFSATAGPRSKEKIKQIAENFMLSQDAFSNATGLGMSFDGPAQGKARNGAMAAPPYYVLNVEGGNGGYIIVSGDDSFREVLGYSESGTFHPDSLPDGLAYWLESLTEEMEYYLSGTPLTASRNRLLGTSTSVSPMLRSHWGQGTPFNAQIPVTSNLYSSDLGGHAAVGCVALSMGQIMNYWSYPSQGQNAHANAIYPSVSINFAEQTYNWNNILDDYGLFVEGKENTRVQRANYSPEQANEVAKLCYHLGVATDMAWGSSEDGASGTANCTALSGLINYFGYNPYAYVQPRSTLAPSEFMSLLISELQAGRPLMYSGSSSVDGSVTGHFFIIDGYDASTSTFHFNWGWQGINNGYYALSALIPDENEPTDNYNYRQIAYIGVQPQALYLASTPAVHAGSFTLQSTTIKKGERARITAQNFFHDDHKFEGRYGIAIYSTSGTLEAEQLVSIYGLVSGTYTNYPIDFYSPYFNRMVPNGEHIMKMVMKSTDGTYYPLHSTFGNPESWRVVVTAGATSRDPGTVTFTPIVQKETNDIDDIASEQKVVRTEYYTMGGIRISEPRPGGITLCRKIYANGKVVTEKVKN